MIIDLSDSWAANVAKQEAALKANRNGAAAVVYNAPTAQEAKEAEEVKAPVVPVVAEK